MPRPGGGLLLATFSPGISGSSWLGAVIYHLDGGAGTWDDLQKLGLLGFLRSAFERNVFQTLVHIGVASIWVLPVIGARPFVRALFLTASAIVHVALSRVFYFQWVWNRPGIDGGPLGFLTWTIPLLVGSLVYDAMASGPQARPIGRLIAWACILMAIGYALSCLSIRSSASGSFASVFSTPKIMEPPFVPPPAGRSVSMWMMSQRAGSVSYQTFAAGFSIGVYVLFVWACDIGAWRLGLFRTFGRNALAAYVLHELVAGAVKPFVPRDSPLWFALAGFLLYFAICYLFVRHLERNDIFLRM